MGRPISDLDFAGLLSADIAGHYAQAKNHCDDLPVYALVQIRALAERLCDTLLAHARLPQPAGGLSDKIDSLADSRVIDGKTAARLHALRRQGNKGAHPSEFALAPDGYAGAALQALAVSRDVLVAAFAILHPDRAVPAMRIAATDPATVRALCHRAVMTDAADDQHEVGKLLQAKAFQLRQQAEEDAAAAGDSFIDLREHDRLLKTALFFFEQATERGHVPSTYEVGIAWAEGVAGDGKRSLGESYVARAAGAGHVEANAVLGNWLIHGSRMFAPNVEEARDRLELAARADNPRALADLGAMCHSGLGGPVDHAAAYRYTRRAAEGGFPTAQHNLFIMTLAGQGTPADEAEALAWLRRAADQGYPDAVYALATFIAAGRLPDLGPEDAERLFLRALPLRNEARLELAKLYRDHPDDDRLLSALDLVQKCYEIALDDGAADLAADCRKLAPGLLDAARGRLPSLDEERRKIALVLFYYFDDKGRPHRNRDQRQETVLRDLQSLRNGDHGRSRQKLIPKRLRPHLTRPARAVPKIGRNSPCPCGSGKKFKACCGA